MSPDFITDEHVPRVFITTARSAGYAITRATDVFGEATDDTELLRYCAAQNAVLITHDKKDFSGDTGDAVDHTGIIIYTDANFLRDHPETAVKTIERVLSHYSAADLDNALIWLDQWRT
jgi:hypothetical protein